MSFKRSKDIKSTREHTGYKFTKNEKLKIIREVEEGQRRSDVCTKYGIAYITLCSWLKETNSPMYSKGKNTRFTKAERKGIVRSVMDGTLSKEQACANHNISQALLWYWMSEFKKEEQLLADRSNDAMTNDPHTHSRRDDELAIAKLKIKALETLIDVAEEQFKISIRKKPGAKQ
jgi:transposase-like protein